MENSALRTQHVALRQEHSPITAQQPTEEPLRNKTARAALTSGGGEVLTRVLTVVLSIVSARVLEPAEVGLLGLAVIVIGIVSMLGFYPETAAVAARRDGSDHQYAFAATGVRAIVAAFSLVLLWLTFPVVAHYLTGKDDGADGLRNLLAVLAWVPVLELLSGYPQVIMQRRLELTFIARLQILQPIVFVGLAVALLLSGRGYVGVAWANVLSSSVTAVLLWGQLLYVKEFKWEGWPSRQIRREVRRGSVKIFVGGFGGYLTERVDNIMVAATLGPTAMSFYSMAWTASRTPANVFRKAIDFVLIPTIARIQDDPIRVQRALRDCLRHSYVLLAPICASIFVSAPSLVIVVLGAKWLPLVPCLRVMCVTVLASPILSAANALLVSAGRAHLVGIATTLQLLALILFVPFLAHNWGIVGASYGDMLAVSILTTTICGTARIAARGIEWHIISTLVLPVAAAIVAGILAWNATSYLTHDTLRLIAELGLVMASYPLIITAMGGRAALLDLLALLSTTIRRSTVATVSRA